MRHNAARYCGEWQPTRASRAIAALLFAAALVACGNKDGGTENAGGNGGSSSGGAGGFGGGGGNAGAAGGSTGGQPGTNYGVPCSQDAECKTLRGTPRCLTDYPGGYCTGTCTNDGDCNGGICDEHGSAYFVCFVSCYNPQAPDSPKPCPEGLVCERQQYCVPPQ